MSKDIHLYIQNFSHYDDDEIMAVTTIPLEEVSPLMSRKDEYILRKTSDGVVLDNSKEHYV